MHEALNNLRRMLAALAAVERALVTFLILFIVANIGAQVFSRYVLGEPLIWVEEAATYAFIWAVFLGAGLGMKHGRHIRISTFVERLPPAGAAAVRLFTLSCIFVLTLVLMRQAWTIIGVEGMRSTIALPVQLPASWFLSVPLFVGMASIGVTVLYLIADEVAAVIGDRPRRPILPLADG